MMLNIFEGARRVCYLIVVLIILAGIGLAIENEPSQTFYFKLPFPDKPIMKIHDEDCEYDDAIETSYRKTPKGYSYTISICFKAFHMENGEVILPFIKDGKVLGNDKYSAEAIQFRNDFLSKFSLPKHDIEAIEAHYLILRFTEIAKSLGLSIAVAFGFWTACWIVGWIVRGFLGVPMGKDFKS